MFKVIQNLFSKFQKPKIRHYFAAPIKENAKESEVLKQIEIMRNLKKKIPQIKNLNVGRNKQIVGGVDAIFMSADFVSVAELELFLDSPHHAEMFVNIIEVLKIEEMLSGQVVEE